MKHGIALIFWFSILQAGASPSPLVLNGAGSTFVYPIFSKWFNDYLKIDPSVLVNYQSIGSGGGVRQLTDQIISFAATDMAMTDEQLKKAKRRIDHYPVVMGAVVITYQIPGVKQSLRFSGAVIADIFLGKIVKWNDPRITAENPGVKLPNSYITVVHRSDGSGTSAVFTDYLSKISPEWKDKVGSATSVQWPIGLGGKGNEGVTGLVKALKNTIGYVELTFAISQKLPVAQVKNREGQWSDATPETVSLAADQMLKLMPDDFRLSITDAPGKKSYPISSFSYFLLDSTLNPEKRKPLMRLLKWSLTAAQADAEKLHYAALPKTLAKKLVTRLEKEAGLP